MSSVENDSAFRVEKSLGILTTKFVSLLQNSKNGILDLNTVVIRLLPLVTVELSGLALTPCL